MFAALASFTCIRRFVFFACEVYYPFVAYSFTQFARNTRANTIWTIADNNNVSPLLGLPLFYIVCDCGASASSIFDRTFDMCFFSFIRSICGLEQSARRKNICANWRERWSARENSMNTFPSSNAHAISMCLTGAECLSERSLQNARCWCRNTTTQIYRNLV